MSEPFTKCLAEVLTSAAHLCGDDGGGAALRVARQLGVGGFARSRMTRRMADGEVDGELVMRGLVLGFLKDAAEELSSTFTRRGIQHFFVKGVAVADRIYRSGEREMVDIDVHVLPDDREGVRETLEQLAYAVPPDDQQQGPEALRAGFYAERSTGSDLIPQIGVDLAWGLDPVEKLLPRPDVPVPREVWNHLDMTGPLPVPCDAHHVAFLVHHMVHHDMLHFRGLVDLALLWPRVPREMACRIEVLARKLGVMRATRLLASVLQANLGVTLTAAWTEPRGIRSKLALRMLDPVSWTVWASRAADAEFIEINVRRIRRRWLLLDDIGAAPALLADAVVPPREYLRWRWPEARTTAGAFLRHLSRVLGKLT